MQTKHQNDTPWHPTRESAYRAAVLVSAGKCAGHIAETGPSTAPASASALLAPMANSTTLRASMMVPSPWVTQ